MPPSFLPNYVGPAVIILWAIVIAHVKLVRQGRLKGYNIARHFIAITAIACVPFISFFVTPRWHGGAKMWLIGSCFALMMVFGSLTHKLPASIERKQWKKVTKRT